MPRIQVRNALDVVEIDVRIVVASGNGLCENQSGPRHDIDEIDGTLQLELRAACHACLWGF